MKPTKMRNLQIYKATLEFRSRQLASPLSKDLRKKYGKRSTRVIEGDTVLVVRGEYKEISGKVIKSNPVDGTIAIEDVKREKGKGEKIDIMIHASNVVITALDTADKWRRARLEGKKLKNIKLKEPVSKDTAAENTELIDAKDTTVKNTKLEKPADDTVANTKSAKPKEVAK